MIEPSLRSLANKYKLKKRICRKCYSSNPIKNKNCRKKKCGHAKDLRMKKNKIKKK